MTDRHDADGRTPEPATPEQGTPDPGTPELATPERGAPERARPEQGTPERGVPERGAPEWGAPEPGMPTAGRPPAPSAGEAAPPPRLEMPTAGRKPPSVTGPIGRPVRAAAADDDEPTIVRTPGDATRPLSLAADDAARALARSADGEDRAPARPDDDETRPLTRPASVVPGRPGEPSRPSLEDDETTVLRAPARPAAGQTAGLNAGQSTGLNAGQAAGLDAGQAAGLDAGPTAGLDAGPAAGLGAEPVKPPAEAAAVGDEPTLEREKPAADVGEASEDPPAPSEADPERVTRVNGGDGDPASGPQETRVRESGKPKRKLTSAGTLIWVLLLLLGYTLVVQLRSNNDDQGLATARQEDLVSILSDLESRDSRLQTEISSLQDSQRQLNSGVSSRQAALAEAEKRANELGLLAGTLPGKGPGLQIVINRVKASQILNAVQELRGAGGEVMELAGADGTAVRVVASSYFVDAEGGGIDADGTRLNGPWTLWVIGPPQTMQPALNIPGGVVESIKGAGGSVTMEAETMVEVTAVRKAGSLQYAKPTS
jgi:uncharacterized protein YlxW (UPF0749 family)